MTSIVDIAFSNRESPELPPGNSRDTCTASGTAVLKSAMIFATENFLVGIAPDVIPTSGTVGTIQHDS